LFLLAPPARGPGVAAMDRLRRQIASREAKEAKVAKEAKDPKEAKETKEPKEIAEPKEPKEVEAKEATDESSEDAGTLNAALRWGAPLAKTPVLSGPAAGWWL